MTDLCHCHRSGFLTFPLTWALYPYDTAKRPVPDVALKCSLWAAHIPDMALSLGLLPPEMKEIKLCPYTLPCSGILSQQHRQTLTATATANHPCCPAAGQPAQGPTPRLHAFCCDFPSSVTLSSKMLDVLILHSLGC